MKRIVSLVGALALVCAPMAAFAQSASPPDAGQYAERAALAERYFTAVHFQENLHAVLKAMVPAMIGQVLANKPNLSEAERTKIIAAATDAVTEGMNDILSDYQSGVVRVVAETYTTEELTALVGFYESPIGRAIADKQIQMSEPISRVMLALIPKLQTSVRQHMCEKLGCGAPAAPAAKPS